MSEVKIVHGAKLPQEMKVVRVHGKDSTLRIYYAVVQGTILGKLYETGPDGELSFNDMWNLGLANEEFVKQCAETGLPRIDAASSTHEGVYDVGCGPDGQPKSITYSDWMFYQRVEWVQDSVPDKTIEQAKLTRSRFHYALLTADFVSELTVLGPAFRDADNRLLHRWGGTVYLRSDGTLWGESSDHRIPGLTEYGLVPCSKDLGGGRIVRSEPILFPCLGGCGGFISYQDVLYYRDAELGGFDPFFDNFPEKCGVCFG